MKNYIKVALQNAIEAYKCRKYRDFFDANLLSCERNLVLPFLHFLTQQDIQVAYNVGAAVGYFATALAKQKNIKQVVAFEPLPDSWNVLRNRVRDISKIACFNMAVGARSETARFFVTADGDSSSCLPPAATQSKVFPGRGLTKEIEVQVGRLDEIITALGLPLPDVLIVDTQGYELEVIMGAEESLKRVKYCILECSYVQLYEGAPLVNEVYDHLMKRGWAIAGVGQQLCDQSGKPISVDIIFSSSR